MIIILGLTAPSNGVSCLLGWMDDGWLVLLNLGCSTGPTPKEPTPSLTPLANQDRLTDIFDEVNLNFHSLGTQRLYKYEVVPIVIASKIDEKLTHKKWLCANDKDAIWGLNYCTI